MFYDPQKILDEINQKNAELKKSQVYIPPTFGPQQQGGVTYYQGTTPLSSMYYTPTWSGERASSAASPWIQNMGISKPGETSAWGKAMQAQNVLQGQQAREQATKLGAAQAAQGASQMARAGALTSGARERLAQSGMEQAMMGRQQAAMEQAKRGLGIAGEDAATQQRNSLAAAQLMGGLTQADIQNQMRGTESYNQFWQKAHEMAMKAWSAQQTANAMED